MILEKHKAVYLHIPKTAGTSLTAVFNNKVNWKKLYNDYLVGYDKKKGLYTQHLSLKQIQTVYNKNVDDYYVFCFVRNPWEKILSTFTYFHSKKNYSVEDIKNKHLMNFLNTPKWADPAHKKTQVSFLESATEKQVDFIGRFESLEKDFKIVCDKLKIEYKLPSLNKSKHTHYSNYYTPETKKIIEDVYGEDIEKFKYTFETE